VGDLSLGAGCVPDVRAVRRVRRFARARSIDAPIDGMRGPSIDASIERGSRADRSIDRARARGETRARG